MSIKIQPVALVPLANKLQANIVNAKILQGFKCVLYIGSQGTTILCEEHDTSVPVNLSMGMLNNILNLSPGGPAMVEARVKLDNAMGEMVNKLSLIVGGLTELEVKENEFAFEPNGKSPTQPNKQTEVDVLVDIIEKSSKNKVKFDEVDKTFKKIKEGKKVPELAEYGLDAAAIEKEVVGTVTGNLPPASSNDPMSILNNAPIPLLDANYMYQPTKGTSSNTRYHLVAKSGKVRIAVRMKGDSDLSIRVEGYDDELAKLLVKRGFSKKENYISIHMETVTRELTFKTWGAMLFSLALPFDQVVVDLSPIAGEGI